MMTPQQPTQTSQPAPRPSRPIPVRAPAAAVSAAALPLALVLLPLMAYANLWIMDRVPGLDWIEQTLPRVGLTLLVIAYAALCWLVPGSTRRAVIARARRWRTLVALAVVAISVLTPLALFMADRLARGPYPDNVIDWPLQIEAGSRLLLDGRSPYAVDYSTSEMQIWSERANFPTNPALRHAIHLPINFVLGAATLPIWQAAFGWYDARVLLIAAFALTLLLAPRLTSSWEDGHTLLIGLALNPLLVDTFVVGLSDFLLLGWLVLALFLRQRRHFRAAAAVLGLAVATRQFAWVLVPLWLAAEWFALPAGDLGSRVRMLLRRGWPFPVVALGTILPFLLANPAGFYADVIAFGSGNLADAYPIGGPHTYGLSVLVLALGWAPGPNSQFPFGLIQLLATLPALGLAVWHQRRANTLRRMLLGYAIVLAVFLFTGRFMHANYVGYIFAVLLLAVFVADTPLGQEQTSAS